MYYGHPLRENPGYGHYDYQPTQKRCHTGWQRRQELRDPLLAKRGGAQPCSEATFQRRRSSSSDDGLQMPSKGTFKLLIVKWMIWLCTWWGSGFRNKITCGQPPTQPGGLVLNKPISPTYVSLSDPFTFLAWFTTTRYEKYGFILF